MKASNNRIMYIFSSKFHVGMVFHHFTVPIIIVDASNFQESYMVNGSDCGLELQDIFK